MVPGRPPVQAGLLAPPPKHWLTMSRLIPVFESVLSDFAFWNWQVWGLFKSMTLSFPVGSLSCFNGKL